MNMDEKFIFVDSTTARMFYMENKEQNANKHIFKAFQGGICKIYCYIIAFEVQ